MHQLHLAQQLVLHKEDHQLFHQSLQLVAEKAEKQLRQAVLVVQAAAAAEV